MCKMDAEAPQPASRRESLTPERSRLHALFASIEAAAEIGAALPPEPMRRLLAGIALTAREGMEATKRASEVDGRESRGRLLPGFHRATTAVRLRTSPHRLSHTPLCMLVSIAACNFSGAFEPPAAHLRQGVFAPPDNGLGPTCPAGT